MADILVGEAARILKCSESLVRYLDRTGQLNSRRIGHIRVFAQDEVEALQEKRLELQLGMPRWTEDQL